MIGPSSACEQQILTEQLSLVSFVAAYPFHACRASQEEAKLLRELVSTVRKMLNLTGECLPLVIRQP